MSAAYPSPLLASDEKPRRPRSWDLVPMPGKVVVERHVLNKSSGGLMLPAGTEHSQHSKTHAEGNVIAVGPLRPRFAGDEAWRAENWIKFCKGDLVAFQSFAGTEVNRDGDKLVILDETEVLAIIESAERTNRRT